MESGHPLDVPPYFDGTNYCYWKIRMRVFLQAMNMKVWFCVKNGWTKPETNEDEWSKDELNERQFNFIGLNSIVMAISDEVFKRIYARINEFETSKEVWDILETTYECTDENLKKEKLMNLAYRFEEIRMNEDESFDGFYVKLIDIVNLSFNLGERIPESRIVRKVLGSLPKRFRYKVIAIKECRDLDSVKIDELVGSLKAYELGFSNEDSLENFQNGKHSKGRKEKKTQANMS
jgi:hypothetical protein